MGLWQPMRNRPMPFRQCQAGSKFIWPVSAACQLSAFFWFRSPLALGPRRRLCRHLHVLGATRAAVLFSRGNERLDGSYPMTAGRFVGKGDLNAIVRPKIMIRVSA